jgi:hypothetical protein
MRTLHVAPAAVPPPRTAGGVVSTSRSTGDGGISIAVVAPAELTANERAVPITYFFQSTATLLSRDSNQELLDALLSRRALRAMEAEGSVGLVKQGLLSQRQAAQPRVFLDVYQPPAWIAAAGRHWCSDARRCLHLPNAGGNSVHSEVLSVQYFHDRWHARKFLLEMEIEYMWDYKKSDCVATIHGHRVGISVTRAMSFPNVRAITHDQATHLLRKKLSGLVIACAGVSERHGFATSVLHVLVSSPQAGQVVKAAYESLVREEDAITDDVDEEARIRDVIVIVTVCTNSIEIYFSTSRDNVPDSKLRPFAASSVC